MVESLEKEEFMVCLQPKVEIDTGKIIGAEALVRWNHPKLGIIPPDDFIPAFERNGFIYTMDLYGMGKGMLHDAWVEDGGPY